MSKEMLINTVAGQECRIAITRDGRLEELYVERASSASHVGNIYKGRITNVEPSIQAAFVDFGLAKNGFLHISDVHPKYFPAGKKDETEQVGRKRPHHHRPPIQECFRRGQEVVVQMTKEGIGTKGPTMTTYLSIPGRLLVMMPRMARLGVSRKVEDPEARSKTRAVLDELKLPADMGFIVRTAGVGRSKRDLQRDLNYLTRLWRSVKQRVASARPPAEIYQESDLVTRTIRDIYNTDIDRVICDRQATAEKVQEFLSVAMPRTKHNIELYTGKEGLFHDSGLEEEIERIYSHRVELPSGGSLIIDQTEALVAIDVNSGRFREHSDAETTALKMNQEAAKEIARQLRLRDLGGVIIIDFIDMREEKHRRAVEKTLREAMKIDRAKAKVLKISNFGIVEMTRQRMRPSLKDSIYRPCAFCEGSGRIKSEESQALQVMRSLQRAVATDDVLQMEVHVTPPVAHHLSNVHRAEITELETQTGKRVVIRGDADLKGDDITIRCTNARGNEVSWDRNPLANRGKVKLQTVPLDQAENLEPEEDQPQPVQAAPAAKQPAVQAPVTQDEAGAEDKPKKRRRGRRGGRKHKKRGEQAETKTDETPQPPEAKPEPPKQQTEQPDGEQPVEEKKAKKSRRRRRKKAVKPEGAAPAEAAEAPAEKPAEPAKAPEPAPGEPAAEAKEGEQLAEPKAKKPRRRRRKKAVKTNGEAAEAPAEKPAEPAKASEPTTEPAAEAKEPEQPVEMKAKKSRRRRKKAVKAEGEAAGTPAEKPAEPAPTEPAAEAKDGEAEKTVKKSRRRRRKKAVKAEEKPES